MSNYINQKELYELFKSWKEEYNKDPNTKIPEAIGKAVILIAYNYAKLYKWSSYTKQWKEDMIGDGIEHCVRYVHNFDPVKYKNPHTYITELCKNAFIQRIKKDKRVNAARYKHFIQQIFDIDMVEHNGLDYNIYLDINNKVHEYENQPYMLKNKKKKKPKEHECLYDIPEENLTESLFIESGDEV